MFDVRAAIPLDMQRTCDVRTLNLIFCVYVEFWALAWANITNIERNEWIATATQIIYYAQRLEFVWNFF